METISPIGERALSLVEVHDRDRREFVERLREHPAIASIVAVEDDVERGVYAIERHEDPATFFTSVPEQNARLLNAVRPDEHLGFEIRSPSREVRTAFREQIDQAGLGLEVVRVSRTDRSTPDPKEGLSEPQREASELAIARGYFRGLDPSKGDESRRRLRSPDVSRAQRGVLDHQ